MVRKLMVVLLGVAVVAPSARAAFLEPTELAQDVGSIGATLAVDDGGAVTAVVVPVGGAPRLVLRPSTFAPWAPGVRLPGRALGRPAGPVAAAAGQGAAVVAWRTDTPRRYGGIAAMARDAGAGATFSAPVAIAGENAGGVRHPAVAIDPDGHAVLAYNSGTRATHLSIKGGVSVAIRNGAGRAFAAPLVVERDPSAAAPAVALARDGRGVVAWVAERRVWVASVDADAGRVGRAQAVTGAGRYDDLRAAAGPDGAATLAFVGRDAASRRTQVAVVRRAGGGDADGFGRVQVVARATAQQFVGSVALAADGDGRATIAWATQTFGQNRGIGVNGATATVYAATATVGARVFRHPLAVGSPARQDCTNPSLAASAGHAALTFSCRTRGTASFYTARVSASGVRVARPLVPFTPPPPSYGTIPATFTGLDSAGVTTLLLLRPDPIDPTKPTPTATRLLATTGR